MKNSKNLIVIVLIFIVISIDVYGNLSLRVGDPRNSWSTYPGTIEDVVMTVKPHGSYNEIGLFFTVTPEGSPYDDITDTLEAVLRFRLNEKCFINDSWLFLDDTTYVIAELMDQWTAGYIYEGIVSRRKDPSILFKRSITDYEIKIFPMLGNSKRTVKLNYFVPVEWNRNDVVSMLPFDISKVSKKVLDKIDVIVFPDNNFVEPFIDESMYSYFTFQKSKRYGDGYRAKIAANLAPQLPVGLKHKFADSIFIAYDEFENEKYYQAIIPNTDFKIDKPKKLMLVLDYEVNKSNITKEVILQQIKNTLISSLYDQDYFNLFFSTDENVYSLSNEWIPADAESIEYYFQYLAADSLRDTSNLEEVLMKTGEWIQEYGDSQEVLIVANTDRHGEQETANKLGSDFLELVGKNTRVHVVSFLQKNWKRYFINGIGYAANDYLYNGLVKLSQGYYNKIFDYKHDFQKIMNYSVNFAVGGYESISIHVEPETGFAYDEYVIYDELESEYQFFAETGRFIGEAPLNVVVSGFFRDEPFYKEYTVNNITNSYDNTLIWAGERLRNLENESSSDKTLIYKIINESLKYNVLSIYTAFLALDTFEKHNLDAENIIPVELINFEGEIIGNHVALSWATASEKNNFGFYIDRLKKGDDEWNNIGFISGSGNSNELQYYDFKDDDIIINNTYSYRLRQTDMDGTIALSPNTVVLNYDKNINFVFEQNFPNPVKTSTTFRFVNPVNASVSLGIYDLFGNEVANLISRVLSAGDYEVNWNGLNSIGEKPQPGIYFAKLMIGTESKVIKLLIAD